MVVGSASGKVAILCKQRLHVHDIVKGTHRTIELGDHLAGQVCADCLSE